jgi:hypothetical protein
VDVYIHIFLNLALVGNEWSASCPGRFTTGKRTSGTHWIGGWVCPRAGMDDVEKRKFLPPQGLELRTFGRSARSQSLYRLRYRGSFICIHVPERSRGWFAPLTPEALLTGIQKVPVLRQWPSTAVEQKDNGQSVSFLGGRGKIHERDIWYMYRAEFRIRYLCKKQECVLSMCIRS